MFKLKTSKFKFILFLIFISIFVIGCENVPPEDIASEVQANYDSISSLEMDITESGISGSGEFPGYGSTEEFPLPTFFPVGNFKIQKPDKIFINYASGDKSTCLGNVLAESIPKIKNAPDLGIKIIDKTDSRCAGRVKDFFSVFHTVVGFIERGEISKELLNDEPTIKVVYKQNVDFGSLNDGKDRGSGEVVYTYWINRDSLLIREGGIKKKSPPLVILEKFILTRQI